jgi:SOS-response transcriptional repressor LexA
MNLKPKKNLFERSQPVTSDFFNVPVLGMVRAGYPDPATGDYDLGDLVANYRRNRNDSVTLEVLDNAMQNAGILRGDFLTVDLNSRPDNGDIAVVKLGERFFIRKFFRQDKRIRLETSGNPPAILIIETKTPGFEIIGKVQSISRTF